MVRLSGSMTAMCFLQILGYQEAIVEAEQLWGLLASGSLVLGATGVGLELLALVGA